MKYTPKSKINQDVARHVMGWRKSETKWHGGYGVWVGEKDGDYRHEEDWNPAKHIEHAMMVLQKFMPYEYLSKYGVQLLYDTLRKLYVVTIHLEIPGTEAEGYFGEHKQLCVAICLAALRAKGVKGY